MEKFTAFFILGIDILVRTVIIYLYGQERRIRRVSPRPKPDKSKHHRFELRLDDEMNNMLDECSKKLETSKTEVINKGIKMVKSKLDKK